MIILIIGLPNSGKTQLAKQLAKHFHATHWNADEVRTNLNKDLGFTIEDRIEQAKRMRFLCDTVSRSRSDVVCDFVCPTEETRSAFGSAFMIWMDRINPNESRFEDTRNLFQEPKYYNFRYTKSSTLEDVVAAIELERSI